MNVATQIPATAINDDDSARSLAGEFVREGFAGPLRFFSDADCRNIVAHFKEGNVPAPADWEKGRAVTDRFLYDLAVRPELIGWLTRLLGSNVILWGADIIRRKAGQVHHWHTDIESSDPKGRFASVWIGIENTTRDSALELIRRSHKFAKPIQQVAHEHGSRRGEAPAETVLTWAQERDPAAAIERLDMGDGDAVIFDGRLWHGSHNSRPEGERSALIFQYASADMPVRIPDPSQVNWPFRQLAMPLPPVILISGSDRHAINRLVPAPPKLNRQPMATTWIRPLALPLADDPEAGWKPHRIFRGCTRILDDLQCHASVLSPGRSPHPPHRHPEEELLFVLDGDADIVLADDPEGTNARVEHVGAGGFTYYPPHQFHTIRNSSTAPVTYLMFKWRAGLSGAQGPLDTGVFRYSDIDGTIPDGPNSHMSSVVFQQPTIYLGRLRAHLTHMKPGGGYEAHADAYDVAVLLLSGQIETLGHVVDPHGIVFYGAGESHGIRNAGDVTARYLVIEFRAPGTVAAQKPVNQIRKPAAKEPKQTKGTAPAVNEKSAAATGKRPFISTRKLRRAIRGLLDRVSINRNG